MSGSPDYTTDVSIIASTIEKLPIDIVAQTISTIGINIKTTDIMNPTDLQGSTIMVPIDIQGQYITLDIDIVAQTVGNIDIDIAAQTMGNLSVDLAAQTMGNVDVDLAAQSVGNLAVDITAQSLGTVGIQINTEQSVAVFIGGEWAAKTSNDVDFYTFQSVAQTTWVTVGSYTVPAGSTLLIYDCGSSLNIEAEEISMRLYNTTDNIYYAVTGGHRGVHMTFPKPKRIPAGKTLYLQVFHTAPAAATVHAYMGGMLF